MLGDLEIRILLLDLWLCTAVGPRCAVRVDVLRFA